MPYPHTDSRHDTNAFKGDFYQEQHHVGKHWPWAITRPIILALSHYCGLDFHMENVKIVLDQ